MFVKENPDRKKYIYILYIIYYILKRFFVNPKGLSDANVASLTKKEYDSAVHFL